MFVAPVRQDPGFERVVTLRSFCMVQLLCNSDQCTPGSALLSPIKFNRQHVVSMARLPLSCVYMYWFPQLCFLCRGESRGTYKYAFVWEWCPLFESVVCQADGRYSEVETNTITRERYGIRDVSETRYSRSV